MIFKWFSCWRHFQAFCNIPSIYNIRLTQFYPRSYKSSSWSLPIPTSILIVVDLNVFRKFGLLLSVECLIWKGYKNGYVFLSCKNRFKKRKWLARIGLSISVFAGNISSIEVVGNPTFCFVLSVAAVFFLIIIIGVQSIAFF